MMCDAAVLEWESWKGCYWVRLDRIRIHEKKLSYLAPSNIDYWKESFGNEGSGLDRFLPVVDEPEENLEEKTGEDQTNQQEPTDIEVAQCLPFVQISEDAFDKSKKCRYPRGQREPWPRLEVNEGILECLDGQCRIQARRPSSIRWGLMNVVLDSKSTDRGFKKFYLYLPALECTKKQDLIRGHKPGSRGNIHWSHTKLYRAIKETSSSTKEAKKKLNVSGCSSLYADLTSLQSAGNAWTAFNNVIDEAPHMPSSAVIGTLKTMCSYRCHKVRAHGIQY